MKKSIEQWYNENYEDIIYIINTMFSLLKINGLLTEIDDENNDYDIVEFLYNNSIDLKKKLDDYNGKEIQ